MLHVLSSNSVGVLPMPLQHGTRTATKTNRIVLMLSIRLSCRLSVLFCLQNWSSGVTAELSRSWVDSWVGLGWFGFGWVDIFSVFHGLSPLAKVLKMWKNCVNAFKARLDKFWLHQAVKFDFIRPIYNRYRKQTIVSYIGLGRVGSKLCHLYWVGLGWVSQVIGWVGSGHTNWTHGQLCVTGRSPFRQRTSHTTTTCCYCQSKISGYFTR